MHNWTNSTKIQFAKISIFLSLGPGLLLLIKKVWMILHKDKEYREWFSSLRKVQSECSFNFEVNSCLVSYLSPLVFFWRTMYCRNSHFLVSGVGLRMMQLVVLNNNFVWKCVNDPSCRNGYTLSLGAAALEYVSLLTNLAESSAVFSIWKIAL